MTPSTTPTQQCVFCGGASVEGSIPVVAGLPRSDEYDPFDSYPIGNSNMICGTCWEDALWEDDLPFCLGCALPIEHHRDHGPFSMWIWHAKDSEGEDHEGPALACADCTTPTESGAKQRTSIPKGYPLAEFHWASGTPAPPPKTPDPRTGLIAVQRSGFECRHHAVVHYHGDNSAGQPWFTVGIVNLDTGDHISVPHHILDHLHTNRDVDMDSFTWSFLYETYFYRGFHDTDKDRIYRLDGNQCDIEVSIPASLVKALADSITALTPALSDPTFPTEAFRTFIEDGMSGIDALAAVNFTHSSNTK